MHQFVQYIKFLFRSKNQHGVHSPFVYNLITKCFYSKVKYKDYIILKEFRKRLLNNDLVILVEDFGAGSRVFKSNARQINKVAKSAGIPFGRSKLLFRVVSYFEPASILELGTSLGLATSALSLGNRFSKITSIEGCRETAEVAQEQFDHFKFDNIQLIRSQFQDALKDKLDDQKFDFIYVDGNHQKEATLTYFNNLLSHINNDSVIIFDDIHWSKDMTEAWQEIKSHPKVTITIDTFFWGFVFFRKEQEKQHFSIRV